MQPDHNFGKVLVITCNFKENNGDIIFYILTLSFLLVKYNSSINKDI